MQTPNQHDNTDRTYTAYLPLVAACRPDWEEDKLRRTTFCLITAMQQALLRSETVLLTQGVNLRNSAERRQYHKQILQDFLEIKQ